MKNKETKTMDLSELLDFNFIVNNELPEDTIFLVDLDKMFDNNLSEKEIAKYCIKITSIKI